ncbi:unnamed protein product [Blepharisma stoltei]|uniref:Uncharacterized protein n=1 Tax=Blepharisma stoltei TaxID=1481888 RepID=A0AAU9IYA8_9CILI|nr:unnamed protein product [Blepharisma stoltei]
MERTTEKSCKYIYKIVIAGDQKSGKSTLFSRFTKHKSKFKEPQSGVKFENCNFHMSSGENIKFQLWDIIGFKQYRSIIKSHFRRAVGAFIVYDITSENSFNSAKSWLEDLRIAEPDIIISIIGNKIDKDPSLRKISFEQGRTFAQENDAIFAETSARDNLGVNEAFERLFKRVYDVKVEIIKNDVEMSDQSSLISEQIKIEKNTITKNFCCH